MLNRVVLIGRLTRDAELKYTPQGQAVATLGLAVERIRGKGEETVDFIELVLWRRLAESLTEHLRKGRLVSRNRSYGVPDSVRPRKKASPNSTKPWTPPNHLVPDTGNFNNYVTSLLFSVNGLLQTPQRWYPGVEGGCYVGHDAERAKRIFDRHPNCRR